MFSEKSGVGSQKSFTPSDLLDYMESLMKEAKKKQMRNAENSNYSWLRSRNIGNVVHVELEVFKPMLYKMSAENCALTAVKLDSIVENSKTPGDILAAIKNVLEEQQNATLLEDAIRSAKKGRNKANKVHPELLPPGRQPTVSFILN